MSTSSKIRKRREKRQAEQMLQNEDGDQAEPTTTSKEVNVPVEEPPTKTEVKLTSKGRRRRKAKEEEKEEVKEEEPTTKTNETISKYVETIKTQFEGYLERFLPELRETQDDEERIEITKQISNELLETLVKIIPDCKFATHVVVANRGEESYGEDVELLWEVGRDTTYRLDAEDNKFFIVAWIFFLPLYLPEDDQ